MNYARLTGNASKNLTFRCFKLVDFRKNHSNVYQSVARKFVKTKHKSE